MSVSHNLALALAAALLDLTMGYPLWFAALFGSAWSWISGWFEIVDGAETPGGPWAALAIFLLPVIVAAAALSLVLTTGPFGFGFCALVASAFSSRQSINARARAVARTWENEGPYEALVAAEALGTNEAETRLAPACAGAIAARFADEVAAPTLALALGGLVGLAALRALAVAGRICRERGDDGPFGGSLDTAQAWTLAPAARLGALWLAGAAATFGARVPLWQASLPGATPTEPAETVMLVVLGPPERDAPAYLRRALALYRRAAALEFAALAGLTALVLVVSRFSRAWL
jgi:cobalamin biosynthesis protein CobD/CbiB